MAEILPWRDTPLGKLSTEDPKLAFGQQGLVLVIGLGPNRGKSQVLLDSVMIGQTKLSRDAGDVRANSIGSQSMIGASCGPEDQLISRPSMYVNDLPSMFDES